MKFYLDNAKTSKVPRKKEEANLQTQLVEALRLSLPKDAVIFSIPNGGSRDIREAANLKRQGLLAGCPDLCIIFQGKAFGLELKAQNGSLTDSQKITFPLLRQAGMRVEVARSYSEALDMVRDMGVPLKIQDDRFGVRDAFNDATKRRRA